MQNPNLISNSKLILNKMSNTQNKSTGNHTPLSFRQILFQLLLLNIHSFLNNKLAKILNAEN